jgi:hypothetical protein
LALVVGHLAEEQRLDPHGELALAPGLVEEDDLERSAVVTDRRVDHDPTLTGPPSADLLDLAKDRGLLAHRQV